MKYIKLTKNHGFLYNKHNREETQSNFILTLLRKTDTVPQENKKPLSVA